MRIRLCRQRALWLAAVLLLAMSCGTAFTTTQRGNQLLIDGVPTALTFARGCTDPAQVPAYRNLGFNTLLVRVDSPGTIALERVDALVAAAEQAGLYLLIEIANGSWSSGLRANINNTEYASGAAELVHTAITRYGKAPRLVGWMISTVQEGLLLPDIGTFAKFLEGKYSTLDHLNATWSYTSRSGRLITSKIPTFNVLTEKNAAGLANNNAAVTRLVQADIAEYRMLLAARDVDFQHYLQAYYPSVAEINLAWHSQYEAWEKITIDSIAARERAKPDTSPMSLLDYARYQALAPRVLLEWWVRQVKALDQDRLLFVGGYSSYRMLSNLPPSINGVFTECYPDVSEADVENHNPQAIDIARHGNRFIVFAGVSTRDVTATQLINYLYIAVLHGAAGIGLREWSALQDSSALYTAAQTALADITQRKLLARVPVPHLAIVYSPYAPGRISNGRTPYGYLHGFLYPGPSMLFFMLRQGTCYGQIDYLSPEDLTLLPLTRYHVLLMPSVIDLPDAAQRMLLPYVQGGGIVVADVGLASLQANGNYLYMPQPLLELFRVKNNDPRLASVRMNLEAYRTHRLFPHMIAGMRTTGIANGYAVARIGRITPLAGADLLFSVTETKGIGKPVIRPYKPLEIKPTRGVFIAKQGEGYAIYAPLPLYQLWLPGTMLFEVFHRDLFSHGAELEFECPIDFLPMRAALANYADDSVAMWTKDQLAPVAHIHNAPRRVYRLDAGACEIAEGGTTLRGDLPGYHLAEPLPLHLDAVPFTTRFAVRQVSAKGMVFDLAVDEEYADRTLTLHLDNGAYPVAPDSRHQITLLTAAGGTVQEVQADHNGRLRFSLPAASCRVTITGMVTLVDMEKPTSAPADDREVTIDAVPDVPAPR